MNQLVGWARGADRITATRAQSEDRCKFFVVGGGRRHGDVDGKSCVRLKGRWKCVELLSPAEERGLWRRESCLFNDIHSFIVTQNHSSSLAKRAQVSRHLTNSTTSCPCNVRPSAVVHHTGAAMFSALSCPAVVVVGEQQLRTLGPGGYRRLIEVVFFLSFFVRVAPARFPPPFSSGRTPRPPPAVDLFLPTPPSCMVLLYHIVVNSQSAIIGLSLIPPLSDLLLK